MQKRTFLYVAVMHLQLDLVAPVRTDSVEADVSRQSFHGGISLLVVPSNNRMNLTHPLER